MAAANRPNPGDLPDSPYAAELRRSGARRRFSPELEAEFIQVDLFRNRGLIRTITTCAVALLSGHMIVQIACGSVTPLMLAELTFIMAASVAVAWLAWRPDFERRYQPCASIIVPLRSIVAAAYVAEAAARGQIVFLMTLPVMVISIYFFLGLRLRVSILSTLLTAVSFAVSAVLCHLALAITLHACMYILSTIVSGTILAIQLESRSRSSFLESHLIAELAQRDALTGTKNRRVFNEHLAQIWHQAMQDHRALSILLIDVDHFKAYNDRYGHLAGDEALRSVARTVQSFVQRPRDVLARYGGEEFAAILYDMPGAEAREIAERMRRAVMELGIEHRGSRTAEMVTISIGVAAVEPIDGRECRGALQLADQALYEAKVRGRNTVELMDDGEYQFLVTGVFSKSVAPPPIRRPDEPAARRAVRELS